MMTTAKMEEDSAVAGKIKRNDYWNKLSKERNKLPYEDKEDPQSYWCF
jgi:hypothetical protein